MILALLLGSFRTTSGTSLQNNDLNDHPLPLPFDHPIPTFINLFIREEPGAKEKEKE
jgi:hypothetical protein